MNTASTAASSSLSLSLSSPRVRVDNKDAEERARRRSVWQERRTAGVGGGASLSASGEVFYENRETGETTWERPDDFIPEAQLQATLELEKLRVGMPEFEFNVEEVSAAEAAISSTRRENQNNKNEKEKKKKKKEMTRKALREGLGMGALDILGEVAAKERAGFVRWRPGEDETVCLGVEKRLELFYLFTKHAPPAPELWGEAFVEDEFRLLKTLLQYWTVPETCTPRARLFVAEILLFFSTSAVSLDALTSAFNLVLFFRVESAGFISNLDRGVREATLKSDKGERTMALVTWASLMNLVFSRADPETDLPDSCLPSPSLVSFLFDLLSTQSEEVYIQVANALIAINIHLTTPDGLPRKEKTGNVIISYAAKKSVLLREGSNSIHSSSGAAMAKSSDPVESFCEALQYFLNLCQDENSTKDETKQVLLAQTLRMVQTIFSDPAASGLFFEANDVKIIVDIALLQVINLPPDSFFRVDFLFLLDAIIRDPAWKRDCGCYRVADLFLAMEDIIRGKDTGGMLEPAVEMAGHIMDTANAIGV